ncbi:hypothetical protein PHBOTO_005619 [Pseudozyma hubeiensis]|nr:hypothetical protein PHBOTO_005619 [Pseudozyma hubeiensis]
MSRRLVSYSDLTDDGPEAQRPSETEAGPSRYVNGGKEDGRAKKRKLGPNGSQAKKRVGRGNGTHWDDPDYAAPMGKDDRLRGGYRDDVEGEDVGDEERGSVGEDVDSKDEGMGDEGDDGEGTGSGDEVYTGWKYDEWGKPYDGTQTYPGESDNDDEHDFDYDQGYDSDPSSSDDDNATLPFAIPDVDEFHRLHDPIPSPPTSSTTASTPHRPPHAVGGGGRTLTHLELYSPLSLVQTFNSALSQYCTLHALPRPRFTGSSESALWTDAPKHDSLLAQQVREDAQQVLAQRRSNGGAEPGRGSSSGGGGVGRSLQQQAKARGKPVVTVVPTVGMEGNAAWKKAIKTVETTPNRVGWVWPALETTGATGADGKNGVDAPSAKPAAGTIAAHHPAASSNHPSVNLTNPTPPGNEHDLEKKLHHYWYAGYYAALAACGVTSTPTLPPDSSVPSQAPTTDAAEPTVIPTAPPSIDPPQTSMKSSSIAPQ